jgi:hypothetical protein
MMTGHDLRDTGLTHMAVLGDAPIVIQWRGGHTDFKTTQGYIDRGRVEARRIGQPLPPIPADLLPDPGAKSAIPGEGVFSDRFATSRNLGANYAGIIDYSATPTGIEPVLPT